MVFFVKVEQRGGRTLVERLELPHGEATTIRELKQAVYGTVRRLPPARQRLTSSNGTPMLDVDNTLAQCNVGNGSVISVKDLGPQMDYQMVFVVEYLCPLLVHCAFFLLPTMFYGSNAAKIAHTPLQTLVFTMNVLHYAKRELETMFVHRFSNDTMPLRNVPRNCAHYFVLGGLCVAYPTYAPGFASGMLGAARGPAMVAALVGLWLFAEISNLHTHLTLRALRRPGTRDRKIPTGYGFNLVSCPNYFFEIAGWVCITLLTGSLAYAVFTAAGALQMTLWASKKHDRYVRDFGKAYPSSRRRILPFVY